MSDSAEVRTFEGAWTGPARTTGWELNAGFSLVSIDVPALPIFPALTAGVAVERGLSDRVDLGARYTTWLGYDHRLGPELGVRIADSGPWALGARAHAWVRVAGTAQRGVDLGGDASTQLAAVLTHASPRLAWTVDLGATTQWLLFERLDGAGHVDTVPWLATGDVALEVAWPDRWAEALAMRLELGIPRAPDDPLTVLGVRPRLVMAGHFGRRTPSPSETVSSGSGRAPAG